MYHYDNFPQKVSSSCITRGNANDGLEGSHATKPKRSYGLERWNTGSVSKLSGSRLAAAEIHVVRYDGTQPQMPTLSVLYQ